MNIQVGFMPRSASDTVLGNRVAHRLQFLPEVHPAFARHGEPVPASMSHNSARICRLGRPDSWFRFPERVFFRIGGRNFRIEATARATFDEIPFRGVEPIRIKLFVRRPRFPSCFQTDCAALPCLAFPDIRRYGEKITFQTMGRRLA